MKLVKSAILVATTAAVGCVFAETHTIENLTSYASETTALRVKAGDTITLPELETGAYKSSNVRILTVDGTVATVLEPGIVGIQRLDGTGNIETTAAILSIPDPIGKGRVFVRNSTHWSWQQSQNWENTQGGWENVATGLTDDYPHLEDDIAILPRYNDWGYELDLGDSVTLGGMYIGSYSVDKDLEPYAYRLRGAQGGSSTNLIFKRSDKKSPFIQVCTAAVSSSSDNGWAISVAFGDESHPFRIVCNGEVTCDLGWDGTNEKEGRALMTFDRGSTLELPAKSCFVVTGGSPHNNGGLFACVPCRGKLVGEGDFVEHSRVTIQADFDATDFTGTLVVAGYGRSNYDRNANVFLHDSDTYSNAKLSIEGFVKRADYKTYSLPLGGGYFRIGENHTWPGQPEVGNRLPGRQVTLKGGSLDLFNEQKQWSEGVTNTYATETLAVSNGFTLVAVTGNNDASYPVTLFAADNVVHAGKGSMALRCNGLWTQNGEFSSRVFVRLPGLADHMVGGIVPWLVAWNDQPDYGNNGGWESLRFPTIDADGNVVNLEYEANPLSATLAGANALVDGQDLTLTSDLTVNSLVLRNPYGGSKKIGEGRTLTITSGGLIMNSTTRIGENDWNASTIAADSGAITFGATAYVFANNPELRSGNNISWIMVPMTAPCGFVSAHAGNLTICGDQTGIDDEIVAQAGELSLGIARNNNNADLSIPCEIDVPVRIAGGATLALVAGTNLDPTKNVYFDDAGRHPGKLEFTSSDPQKCVKCYVGGVTIPRGTWGATGSGADNIDDEHFSGSGMLVVKTDELAHPLVIKIR